MYQAWCEPVWYILQLLAVKVQLKNVRTRILVRTFVAPKGSVRQAAASLDSYCEPTGFTHVKQSQNFSNQRAMCWSRSDCEKCTDWYEFQHQSLMCQVALKNYCYKMDRLRSCVRACVRVCDIWHLYSRDIIIRQLVTSPFKSIYFRGGKGGCKNYCRKTTEVTIMKRVPNESKLIYAINFLIVASWCQL